MARTVFRFLIRLPSSMSLSSLAMINLDFRVPMLFAMRRWRADIGSRSIDFLHPRLLANWRSRTQGLRPFTIMHTRPWTEFDREHL